MAEINYKPDEMERRSYEVQEIRAAEGGRIEGYAAVFDQLSEEMWGFREKIAPGAFGESIMSDDIRALWNHNPEYPLGRNVAGTLALQEDELGLAVSIEPPNTSYARDLMESIRRGDVSQMSFGFVVQEDQWEEDHEQKQVTRTLKKVRLFDVSPVTFPAYPQTTVSVRNRISDFGFRISENDRLETGEAGQETGEPENDGDKDPQVRVKIARKRLEIEEKLIMGDQ